jgi:hypothetical protein
LPSDETAVDIDRFVRYTLPYIVIVAMGWDYVSMNLGFQGALCPSPRWYISECGAAVEWSWQRKTELGEKPVPVPLCPPEINPTRSHLGLRGEKLATNRLSYGTALPCLATLPFLTLPFFTLSRLPLPYFTLPYLTLSCLTLLYVTLSHFTFLYLILPYLAYVTLSHFTLLNLILPYLAKRYLILLCLT